MRFPSQLASAVLRLLFPLTLGLAFLAAVYLRFYSGLLRVEDLPDWPAYTAYFVLSVSLWSVLETRFEIIHKCCQQPCLRRWFWSLARLDLLTLALASAAAFFWRGYSFSRITVAIFWGLHLALALAAAAGARAWARRKSRGEAAWLLLIGTEADEAAARRECLPAGAEPIPRRFRDAAEALAALDRADQAPANCREILAVVSEGQWEHLGALAQALERQPWPASLALPALPRVEARATSSFLMCSTGPSAAETVDYLFWKRAFDVAVSAAALAALAPVMAFIAALAWIRSGRPILLRQQRVGRGERRFFLLKFRTLPVAELAESDRRWTPAPVQGWTRFLRETGLDELPQLFNVLRGEMSLVGPRPERPHFVEQFQGRLPFYSIRHRLQAGITGWAQVNGWRGDTSIRQRVAHDLYYLRQWSLALDARILWMTLADFVRRVRRSRTRQEPDARSV